ncbi:unnamed protein product [Protopolystoma xenopodis]|uniref:Uncharacterized protein n=1 Tax=Protopolystoma xenopodis TaxID=117903 RepID=A0A448XR79_9PLAT|nr:unnamed protein product [Protopolystoma xenopodis]
MSVREYQSLTLLVCECTYVNISLFMKRDYMFVFIGLSLCFYAKQERGGRRRADGPWNRCRLESVQSWRRESIGRAADGQKGGLPERVVESWGWAVRRVCLTLCLRLYGPAVVELWSVCMPLD